MVSAILVVDDAPDWREMLAGFIRDMFPQIRVVTAESLQTAQRILADDHFDLAVIDIRLDEGDEHNTDGLALMDYIGMRHEGLQVIIITGYANIEAVKKAMRAGDLGIRPAIDFIEKDKIHLELLPRLKTILSRSG
jgi:DNA-binding NtrC family response regulator